MLARSLSFFPYVSSPRVFCNTHTLLLLFVPPLFARSLLLLRPGQGEKTEVRAGGRDNLEIAPMGKKDGGGGGRSCLLACLLGTRKCGGRGCSGWGLTIFFSRFSLEARAKPKPEGRLNFSSSPPAPPYRIVIGRYLLCMLVVWKKGKGWRG